MKIKVVGAKIPVLGSIPDNEEIINDALNYAIQEKADIMLTPEGSLSGYNNIFDQKKVQEALDRLIQNSSKAKIGLALGTCFFEPHDSRCYNEIRFYDKTGKFLGSHAKILRTTGESHQYYPMPLKIFNFHGVTIGGLICNDMWANPECTEEPDSHLTRQLVKMGAKIIFHAVNGGRSSDPFMQVIRNYHESNLQMRANADKVWIVTVDNNFPMPCSAPCGVIKPDGLWAIRIPCEKDTNFSYTIEI
jgi:predicted amidohydrolase